MRPDHAWATARRESPCLLYGTLLALLASCDSRPARVSPFAFERTHLDAGIKPGWVRTGDMDRDGDLDIVVGGGNRLWVFENDGSAGGWVRHGNLDASAKIGANGGDLYDLDGDGDLDVVSAGYYDDLGWWENPGGALKDSPWTFHVIADEDWFTHDVLRADLDQDGVAEEFLFNLIKKSDLRIRWLRRGANPGSPWENHLVQASRDHGQENHAGFDVGDIDRDGNVDVSYSNGWYRAPDEPDGVWTWHPVTNVYGLSNTVLRDLDSDGHAGLGGAPREGRVLVRESGGPCSR